LGKRRRIRSGAVHGELMQHTGTAELLEREAELERLDALVDRAAGGRGGLALLEGPAGIGKTRLLDTARERARAADMAVLAARASELEREFPFGIARQLFEPLLAAADAGRRERLLHGAAAPAARLLAGEVPAEAADTGDPAWAHFHALYWLVANLADEGPAALIVDDLHWADAGSLRFLQFLAARLAELGVLVVAATRPPEPGTDRAPLDALATDPATVLLRPAPLSPGAVAGLVGAELGGEAGESFCAACRDATGGNPFLLRELLRELAAEGVEPGDAQAPLVRQLAPPTVARAVLLRLARLGDDALALARAVAVLGDGAPLRRAAALAGLDEDRAEEAAGVLARADILAARRPLAFAHPILSAAVHADLEAGARGRAHRRAAALLDSDGAPVDAVAAHLLATEPSGDPFVAGTLRAAAARALVRGAAPAAAACLRRALAEPPPAGERGALMVELARAELAAGDPAGAAEHFERGLEIAGDPRARVRCVTQQVLALQALGRHDESLALMERVAEEAALVEPELALSVEAGLIASASLERSRRAWALRRLEHHRERMRHNTPGARKLLATQAAAPRRGSRSPRRGARGCSRARAAWRRPRPTRARAPSSRCRRAGSSWAR
jgi:hypothetical protein